MERDPTRLRFRFRAQPHARGLPLGGRHLHYAAAGCQIQRLGFAGGLCSLPQSASRSTALPRGHHRRLRGTDGNHLGKHTGTHHQHRVPPLLPPFLVGAYPRSRRRTRGKTNSSLRHVDTGRTPRGGAADLLFTSASSADGLSAAPLAAARLLPTSRASYPTPRTRAPACLPPRRHSLRRQASDPPLESPPRRSSSARHSASPAPRRPESAHASSPLPFPDGTSISTSAPFCTTASMAPARAGRRPSPASPPAGTATTSPPPAAPTGRPSRPNSTLLTAPPAPF
jgi:hypothetical protein